MPSSGLITVVDVVDRMIRISLKVKTVEKSRSSI